MGRCGDARTAACVFRARRQPQGQASRCEGRDGAARSAALPRHLLTKQQDYTWARPALVAMKQHDRCSLRPAPTPRRQGNAAGPTRDYSVKGSVQFSRP